MLGIREALADADPHDARAIAGVARTSRYIGEILRDQKKPWDALRYDLRALSIVESQSAQDAKNLEIRVDLAETQWSVGDDYLGIAESGKDKAAAVRDLHLAQFNLRQAQAGMKDAKAHDLLYGDLVTAPQKIEQDLSRCDALLRAPDSAVSRTSVFTENR